MNLVLGCVTQRYAKFSGRARRKEYWLFVLAFIVASVVALGIDISSGTFDEIEVFGVSSTIVTLGLLIPYVAVSVRRLHDTNRSGWWVMVNLIPGIGYMWFIALCCLKGDEGENQFGSDPLASVGNSVSTKTSTPSSTIDNSQDASFSEVDETYNSTNEK